MQDRPVCFECHDLIDQSPIFEAPCGHDECPSAVFHGLCLMQFRERRESGERFQIVGILVRRAWSEEHTENEERS